MILINGNSLNVTYFSNTETRIKEFKNFIKPYGNYIELKYETENPNYKINDDLMQLYFVKQEFDSLGIEVSLVLWSMPYQRMDHKNADDVHTLPYVAKFLNDLNFVKILVIEPHSIETIKLLGENAHTIYPVFAWINNIVEQRSMVDNNFVVVFPDAGAFERYNDEMFSSIKICVFSKKRDHNTNEIVSHYVKGGEIPEGSTCYIVDDICSSGQTLLDVAKYVKIAGAKEVFVIAAHCENAALNGDLLKPDSPVDMMYTSDSMISANHEKITYMSIDKAIIEMFLEK